MAPCNILQDEYNIRMIYKIILAALLLTGCATQHLVQNRTFREVIEGQYFKNVRLTYGDGDKSKCDPETKVYSGFDAMTWDGKLVRGVVCCDPRMERRSSFGLCLVRYEYRLAKD